MIEFIDGLIMQRTYSTLEQWRTALAVADEGGYGAAAAVLVALLSLT